MQLQGKRGNVLLYVTMPQGYKRDNYRNFLLENENFPWAAGEVFFKRSGEK
jgi:hypothetical protein